MLKLALQSWLEADSVAEVFVIAQASKQSIFKEYEKVMTDLAEDNRVNCSLYPNGIGSIKRALT